MRRIYNLIGGHKDLFHLTAVWKLISTNPLAAVDNSTSVYDQLLGASINASFKYGYISSSRSAIITFFLFYLSGCSLFQSSPHNTSSKHNVETDERFLLPFEIFKKHLTKKLVRKALSKQHEYYLLMQNSTNDSDSRIFFRYVERYSTGYVQFMVFGLFSECFRSHSTTSNHYEVSTIPRTKFDPVQKFETQFFRRSSLVLTQLWPILCRYDYENAKLPQ